MGIQYSGAITLPQGGFKVLKLRETILNNVVFHSSFDAANGTTAITDSLGNSIDFVGDAVITTTNFKFGNSSLDFPSTSTSYIKLGDEVGSFGSDDFTIEFWHYLTTRNSNTPALFSNYSTWGLGGLAIFAGHYGGSPTKYQIACNNVFPALQSNTTIQYNTWVHVAVVRDNGVITLYVNGLADGSFESSAVLNGIGSGTWVGVASDNLSNGSIVGQIDEYRVIHGIAQYRDDFVVPTNAFV